MKTRRNVLLNPGPATTTDTVKMAQIVPDICPREKEFADILVKMQRDLVEIVHGSHDAYSTVFFCGSGTICMDVCLNSLLPEGKKILVINNGAYSARAAEMCEHYGLSYIDAQFPLDTELDVSAVERILAADKDIYVVYSTHNETGTGLLNPVREIGALAHKYNCISVVDTISTYALLPINMDEDNIDFCMSSAQKGLMSMSGLSFIVGKTEIIEASKNFPVRSYYCNLYRQYAHFKNHGEMHFTPPVQTVYATAQAIREYFDEGEIKKFERHIGVHEEIRRGLLRLGFKEVVKREWQAGLIAAAVYPDDENWDFGKIHDYCYERGFTIYPGKIAGKGTFRLCSLGAIDVADIKNFFVVFEQALAHCNVSTPVKYNNR
ncbi:MAG: 2-aminoethylphosphonate aminotransferase [Defluviitaleaceae bacterium]|nr:2-aminoethylphosphonate aminotransferase [Defluviitaleaceae bacterium]